MRDFTPNELLQHIVSLGQRREDLLSQVETTKKQEQEALETFLGSLKGGPFHETLDFMVMHYGQPYHVHIDEDWDSHDHGYDYAVTVTELSSADALAQAEGSNDE